MDNDPRDGGERKAAEAQPASAAADREARMAAALRENLKRRKALPAKPGSGAV